MTLIFEQEGTIDQLRQDRQKLYNEKGDLRGKIRASMYTGYEYPENRVAELDRQINRLDGQILRLEKPWLMPPLKPKELPVASIELTPPPYELHDFDSPEYREWLPKYQKAYVNVQRAKAHGWAVPKNHQETCDQFLKLLAKLRAEKALKASPSQVTSISNGLIREVEIMDRKTRRHKHRKPRRYIPLEESAARRAKMQNGNGNGNKKKNKEKGGQKQKQH